MPLPIHLLTTTFGGKTLLDMLRCKELYEAVIETLEQHKISDPEDDTQLNLILKQVLNLRKRLKY